MINGFRTSSDTASYHQLVAQWFEAYQAPLFRYLVRLVGNEERAADLLQDTFVRALRAQGKPMPDNPSAWLYRIATNLAYDALRRRRRLRWLPFRGDEQAPAFEGSVGTAQSVRHCLAGLRPAEAEALLLYEYAGLNCVEIAALQDEEASAVRMRISRARSKFRNLYKKELT